MCVLVMRYYLQREDTAKNAWLWLTYPNGTKKNQRGKTYKFNDNDHIKIPFHFRY